LQIGRRLYYDKLTGNIVFDTGERRGSVKSTTIEQDISTYSALLERNRETFDIIELEFGAFAQDFAECSGYRINPETKQIEFSYPDPNEPEKEPVYGPPLSAEVERLKQEDLNNKEAIAELYLMSMGGF
jgi:hypothetical protein